VVFFPPEALTPVPWQPGGFLSGYSDAFSLAICPGVQERRSLLLFGAGCILVSVTEFPYVKEETEKGL